MDDIYENIEKYNPKAKQKKLINDMIAVRLVIENFNSKGNLNHLLEEEN